MNMNKSWNVVHHPAYWVGDTTGEFKRTELAYPHVPKTHPKFAESMVVGNLIFVSGCTGQDTAAGGPTPKTIEGQMENALDNARIAMETAGSSLENAVKTFILARSVDDCERIREIEVEYYSKHAPFLVESPPATTLLVAASLARPKFLFEYELIGVVDRAAPEWEVTHVPDDRDPDLAGPQVATQLVNPARAGVVGNLVMLSACHGLNHDPMGADGTGFAEQARLSIEKIRIGMEEAGGSLGDLVKTNVFLEDIDDLPVYRDVERSYFEEHAPELTVNPPASTALVVGGFSRSEILIEVEAFGVVDRSRPHWTTRHQPGNGNAAEAVSAGNLLFLSGCDGSNSKTGEVDSDVVEEQIVVALDKVRAAVERAGSSMDDVVKTLMMLRHLDDYPKMRKAEVEYYESHAPRLVSEPPVSTFVQLPAISSPGSLFQIDVTAVL